MARIKRFLIGILYGLYISCQQNSRSHFKPRLYYISYKIYVCTFTKLRCYCRCAMSHTLYLSSREAFRVKSMCSIEVVFTAIRLEGIVFNAHILSPSTLKGHKPFETVQDCKSRTIVQATNYKYAYSSLCGLIILCVHIR